MDTVFPFGFPPTAAFYLVLYVLTLVLHVAFMNYVLAGSLYLLGSSTFRMGSGKPDTLSRLLRDWMPAMLGLAITAGVAPLLFVQVLYQQSFYTANLLLFHRFMAILPLLILAYYLLYVIKSRPELKFHWLLRSLLYLLVAGCFIYTAWAWTENHLLSLNQKLWPDFYASGRFFYLSSEIPPRLTLWLVGAFPNMAIWLAWQCWGYQKSGTGPQVTDQALQRLQLLANGGLLLSVLVGVWYFFTFDSLQRSELVSTGTMPYLAMVPIGLLLQLFTWLYLNNTSKLRAMPLSLITAGAVISTLGISVVREWRRLVVMDRKSVGGQLEDFQWGGLGVFLFFLLLNCGLIGWCIYLAASKAKVQAAETPSAMTEVELIDESALESEDSNAEKS